MNAEWTLHDRYIKTRIILTAYHFQKHLSQGEGVPLCVGCSKRKGEKIFSVHRSKIESGSKPDSNHLFYAIKNQSSNFSTTQNSKVFEFRTDFLPRKI